MRSILAVLLLAAVQCAAGPTSPGAARPAGSDETARVRERQVGAVPEAATPEAYLGRLAPSRRLVMLISFAVRDEAALLALDRALYDASSPAYHRWLTPDEFGLRFGRSEAELRRANDWLREQGFRIEKAWPNRLSIEFSGTSESAERAFRVEMGSYRDARTGRAFYSNRQRPSLPADLEAMTVSLVGLNDAVVAGSGARPLPAAGKRLSSLSPRDIGTAYDVAPLTTAGLRGQGQAVGVIFDSDVLDSDVAASRAMFGLPPGVVNRLVPPGLSSPGVKPGEQDESTLDVTAVSYVAPEAEIDLILLPDLTFASVRIGEEFVVNDGSIRVVDESIVACESAGFDTAEQTLFRQAVAEGIAFFVASGDEGVECVLYFQDGPRLSEAPEVSYPACYDGVTAVGGTQIAGKDDARGNLVSVSRESVWNVAPGVRYDCDGTFEFGRGASGGGVSRFVAKPDYQVAATGFPGGVPEGPNRFVPDVALLAGRPYVPVVENGTEYVFEGTSLAAPLWAGMMALVNQLKGSVQGSPNAEIYRLGAGQYRDGGPAVFRDVTAGNNSTGPRRPCAPRGVDGFEAGFGYDAATGWGAVDLDAFARNVGGPLDETPPTVTGASYAAPTLVVTGAHFGPTDARVRVNGKDVSARTVSQSDTSVTLEGPRNKLRLRPGSNTVTVSTPNGTSNDFVLDL